MDDGVGYLGVIMAAFFVLCAVIWFAIRYFRSKTDTVTEADIMTMVTEGHEQGVLESSEAEMITNIFELDDKAAGDIMIHRKSVVALDSSMTLKDAVRFVLKEGNNSRYPVYREDLDDVIGILHMRDALNFAEEEEKRNLEIGQIPGLLREAHFIPETRNIHSLFKEMQSGKIHMEIVVDEYGQTAGIVTMEDILEEMVGNILDEYDVDEEYIVQASDDALLMSGMTPLKEAEEVLGISLTEDEHETYDTLNGFLISKIGRIPEETETPAVLYGGYQFEVIRIENKMIHTVKVKKVSGDMAAEEAAVAKGENG